LPVDLVTALLFFFRHKGTHKGANVPVDLAATDSKFRGAEADVASRKGSLAGFVSNAKEGSCCAVLPDDPAPSLWCGVCVCVCVCVCVRVCVCVCMRAYVCVCAE